MSEMDSVGSTALMIACIRAAEAGRPGAIFEDRFAHLFAHEKIDAATRGWMADYPVFPSIIRVRTRWIDDVVQQALEDGAVQVVILGAGCCCRAERFGRAGVKFFEVDKHEVLGFKADRLKSAGYTYSAIEVPRDYTAPGLFEALVASGLDLGLRSLVVWEGNTFYLPELEVREGLRELSRAFRDVTIALDYFGPEVIKGESRAPGMRVAIKVLQSFGAPWTGWIADATQLAAASGLRVLEDRSFRTHLARLLPDCDLGSDADAEFGLCLLTNARARRG